MDGWGYAWLAWFAAFLIIEGAAFLKTRNGKGTLSNNIWRWFAVRNHDHGWWVVTRRVVLALLLVVLSLHLSLGVP